MKVKHILQLLSRVNPEDDFIMEVFGHVDNGDRLDQSHGRLRIYSENGRAILGRFTSDKERDRDFYRKAVTLSPDRASFESYIQTYAHLRAKTDFEAKGDLEAGAITPAQYDEAIARIDERERSAQAAIERRERNELARLQQKYA